MPFFPFSFLRAGDSPAAADRKTSARRRRRLTCSLPRALENSWPFRISASACLSTSFDQARATAPQLINEICADITEGYNRESGKNPSDKNTRFKIIKSHESESRLPPSDQIRG